MINIPYKSFTKRLIYSASALISLGIISLFAVDQFVGYSVKSQIYDQIDNTPYRPYAVLLGTAKYVAKNTPNQFYNHRIESTKALFDAKKIDYILLSGDNRTLQYNEPRTMRKDLIKMGIEEQFLFPDYAGFRTLDSIIRAKEVFKAEPMLIISQRFHCERALFIANYHNINAICFAADNPDIYTLVRLREMLARFLMVWELLTEKEPHFLGSPEPLPPPISR
ncbi:SanA/YdcF family protein [Pasteurellaceae bacterium 22721_9_1]